MEVEKDDYELERVVDHYFKGVILFLKEGYVFETLEEDNIMEVLFKYLKKGLPVEIARYIRYHVLWVSRRKVPFDYWAVKDLKGTIRSIRHVYRFKYIDRGYRL